MEFLAKKGCEFWILILPASLGHRLLILDSDSPLAFNLGARTGVVILSKCFGLALILSKVMVADIRAYNSDFGGPRRVCAPRAELAVEAIILDSDSDCTHMPDHHIAFLAIILDSDFDLYPYVGHHLHGLDIIMDSDSDRYRGFAPITAKYDDTARICAGIAPSHVVWVRGTQHARFHRVPRVPRLAQSGLAYRAGWRVHGGVCRNASPIRLRLAAHRPQPMSDAPL